LWKKKNRHVICEVVSIPSLSQFVYLCVVSLTLWCPYLLFIRLQWSSWQILWG